MANTIQIPIGGESAVAIAARAARDAAIAAAGTVTIDAAAVEAARVEVAGNQATVAANTILAQDAAAAAVPAAATATTKAAEALASATAAGGSAASALASAVSALATEANVSAAAANAAIRRTTLALLNAVTGSPTGTVGEVYSEAANNGTYRWSGSAWDLVSRATIPTLDTRATAATLTSAEQLGVTSLLQSTLVNGGANITSGGNLSGLSIPSGSTGNSSLLTVNVYFTQAEAARLAGKSILITVVYTVTANFLTEKPHNATVSANGATTATHVSTTQVGTTLTRIARYTVSANDTLVGIVYQVGTSTSTANSHTLTPTSIKWTAEDNDAMATERAQMLRRLGIGSVWDRLLPAATAGSGGSVITRGGRPVGCLTPIGATGSAGLVQPRLPISPALRALLNGRRLKITWGVTTSAGFARVLTPTGQIFNTSGSATARTISITRHQITSTRRVIEISMLMAGNEAELIPYIVQTGGSAAVADESWELTDYAVDIVSSSGDALTIDQLHDLARQAAAPSRIGLGLVNDEATTIIQANGSTTLRGTTGLNFPSLVTGTSALIQRRWDSSNFDISSLTGRTILWTLAFDCSANFSRVPSLTAQYYVGASVFTGGAYMVQNERISTSRYVVRWRQKVIGTETAFAPFIIFSNAPNAAVEWIDNGKLTAVLDVSTHDVLALDEENYQAGLKSAARSGASQALAAQRGYYRTVAVKTDGTGDYLTPQAAIAAITDATAVRRTLVQIYPGVYDVSPGITAKAYVDMEGTDVSRCWLQCHMPDATAVASLNNAAVINPNVECTVRGLRLSVQNGRYAVHPDSPTGATDTALLFEDCLIEHYGNAGAIAYQTSLGVSGDPGGVFGATSAWGSGLASGQSFTLRRCTLRSPQSAYFAHTNGDYTRPSRQVLEDMTLIPTNAGQHSVLVQPLGDGQNSVLEIRRCVLGGPIGLQAYGNLSDDPALQVANRANVRMVISGSTPVAYNYTDSTARALRIESASTGGSSAVTVSGTAATAMFGDVVSDVSGGGVAAAVYGTWDVITTGYTLGARLGDCSSVSKALVVTVDGGAPLTVTFAANHAGQSNATVLALINAALGAAATASLMDVTERFRPIFADDEVIIKNTDSVMLRRKRAIAYQADGTGRVMTSGDAAALFAGIALEPIPPGGFGRIKARGVLRASVDLERTEAGALSFGLTLGVSGADGRLTLGAAVPLLAAISAADVRVIV